MSSNLRNRKSFRKPATVNFKLQPEELLYKSVALYMRTCWPQVVYRFDFGAGVFMSMRKAVFQKQIQQSRAFPDFFVYHPTEDRHFCGLAMELKAEGVRLFKKDGTHASPHIAEQAQLLEKLGELGYYTTFAVGFEEALDRLEWYFAHTKLKRHGRFKL